MHQLDEGPHQYLSLFFDAETFCAYRFVCKKFRSALNVNHECYYFARVKYISHFRLKKGSVIFQTYQHIFEKIISLHTMEEDIYRAICSSEELIELVYKTPSLLDKLYTARGPIIVINLLIMRPSYHKYLFENIFIVQRFKESEKCWVSAFNSLISSNSEIYNGLLESDEMMLALAFSCRTYCNDHHRLCEILEQKYYASKEKIEAVFNLKSPVIEVELQNQERAEAIYDLLKSLKPFESTESTAPRLEL